MKMMEMPNNLNARTVTIEKSFDAPIQLVWEAWTKSENIVKWWAPNGMDVKVLEHDFTVGGKWKYSMEMANGGEFISEGVYLEIIPLQKIITSADFKPMTQDVELHVSFVAQGEQTKFTFQVVHPTVDYRKQQEQMGIYNGWGSAFKRLEEFLG